MNDTYTYTARETEHPERTVTFTLLDGRMSVDIGPPVEQVEALVESIKGDEAERDRETTDVTRPWVKPLALSLLERGVGRFRTSDVTAAAEDGRLKVRAWYRARGLALLPVTLIDDRVDNPAAAEAFVKEVARRRAGSARPLVVRPFDFWLTWLLAAAAFVYLFRRFSVEER